MLIFHELYKLGIASPTHMRNIHQIIGKIEFGFLAQGHLIIATLTSRLTLDSQQFNHIKF